jgi:hypothetical protein
MSVKLSTETFVHLVLSGQLPAEEIDDFVATWHESEDSRPLPQALGFSEDEYASWVEDPAALDGILASRRQSE